MDCPCSGGSTVIRPKDIQLAKQLEASLLSFDQKKRKLPGIHSSRNRKTLIEQLLESIRRVKYVSVISKQNLSNQRTDPTSLLFDPIKAAVLFHRQGSIDESYWMVFLFVHFGKHPQAGYRYAREVYGRFGDSDHWDWNSTSTNPTGFREWLAAHKDRLKRQGASGGFGNHRKYQSLDAYSATGTGAAVESYINWVGPPRTHFELMEQFSQQTNGHPRKTFDLLYQSMNSVASFGRSARFDYLCMVGKLGLTRIEPGSTYLQNATGPVIGARLLFGGEKTSKFSSRELDRWLIDLDTQLKVGMQVLEDALCNWQKSPEKFKPFRA